MSATTMGKQTRTGKGQRRSLEASGTTTCMFCGESNKASAKFCQNCGRSLERGGGSWFDAQSMTVIGASLVTLLALGLLFASVIDLGEGESPAVSTSARTSSTPAGQPPDLSTMTPREAAIRLFNRVMMADEQGNADEVAQFAPMAIAAYDRLENLDLQAIYHIGLINAAAGDPQKAWEAVERMRSAVPDHLLASVLEHRLATQENDQTKAKQAIERFKAAYDQEIKVDRAEYRGHQLQIDQFQQTFGAADSGS